ncbi:SGNH/GDSL hydrolase family protein [Klebsiella pneumoniae]|uniref:SGNH/GDSL hydrolase family protein n=1 Tax=Klebsiella pneumoniae TaxID=573 RepID=UPI00387125A8
MAITDTQQTAQFAAEAAVSAAEAKQYLIEVQQGYQDISATTQEAINAATAAEASKVAAETAEQNSSVSAVASSESATAAAGSAAQAEEYKNDASEYALNKFTFYKTPSDPDGTIAGLAATTNGQSFRVAEGPEETAAFKTYENQDGVAVLQASQPGTAAVTGTIREFPTLAAAQADATAGNILPGNKCWVLNDDDNTLADEYINNSGTLSATGRKSPSQAAIDGVSASVSDLNNLINDYYLPDGYSAAITDPDGNAAALITDDGQFEIPVLLVGSTKSTSEEIPGYVEAYTDSNGNMAIGIRDNGSVEAPEIMVGGATFIAVEIPGWVAAWTDPEGNITFGIRDDGSVEVPELIAGGSPFISTEIPGWSVAWTDSAGNLAFGIRNDGSVFPGQEGNGLTYFSANESDVIAILGDSYTDSLFTLRDKAYICNLSSLSDYRYRNYGVSGNTATAINKRLVDVTPYFDGETFSQMNAKYAFIMTYQNDASYFINHGMEYYMYNMERLIDSVMAYGAVPIVVAEWVISNEASAQLKAICDSRGIDFIYNGNLMKEVGNLVVSPFNQGHPGTRTNGVIWASLYEYIRRMARPTRSIKIYRQRANVSPSSDADMLFSDRIDMLAKWKEIRVTHRSLPDAAEKYFEELDGRGNVSSWTVRADEYDSLDGTGVSFTDRLLINVTYPSGATGLVQAGFSVKCNSDAEIYIRNILDVNSSIGQAGDVTPGAIDKNTLTPDYLAKYNKPRGAWKKIGIGSGEYIFSRDKEHVMYGDQIQIMLKSASGTLTDITACYQTGGNPAGKYSLMAYNPSSQLLGETFVDFSTWATNGVASIIPLDQVNTPRNLTYNGSLATVASLMSGSTMKKTVGITIPSSRDLTLPVTLQVELWGRYFPKAYLDNSIYNFDPSQVVDSSQAENTFPAASPITSDTCDFRNVTLRASLGATMTPQNTITQHDFACLFWRPLKYIIQIPPYVSISQLTLEITSESDYIQLAKIYIKEVK